VPAESGAETTVRLQLANPPTDACDLYFLSQLNDLADAEARVTWLGVQTVVAIGAERGTVERRIAMQTIDPEAIRTATLLTDVSDFPFPVLVPGRRTMTHPVPGRTLLVRLDQALPPNAQGLRCSFSVEHADARPVDFGVWVGNPPPDTVTEEGLREHAAFSGWTTVRTPFVMRHLTMRLDQPLFGAADIFLAVRVSEGPDVYFCHAYWHEFSVIQTWSDGVGADPSAAAGAQEPATPPAVPAKAARNAVAVR
jgi:hypothetical protein